MLFQKRASTCGIEPRKAHVIDLAGTQTTQVVRSSKGLLKRKDSLYEAGKRTGSWVKCGSHHEQINSVACKLQRSGSFDGKSRAKDAS